jgi:hypothetical protein
MVGGINAPVASANLHDQTDEPSEQGSFYASQSPAMRKCCKPAILPVASLHAADGLP